ncbi:universal stress protein [Oceanimonas sp. CHS3-5]|uniref:universal stress protein n=1 Tax=Oceanimonas sp. CHS3-5 TaxID=3068186 RepID=UPI00273D440D|nr:universal stress protein [Oceanimonas sp. CHS3-5]MDP5292422.1 universal stress protein [Oceanimonas sp. CHS3-5]
MFKEILLPLDFEHQELYPQVVESALRLCHSQGRIHLLYVNPSRVHHAAAPFYSKELLEKQDQAITAQLDDFMQSHIPAEHRGRLEVRHGVVYDTILARAKKLAVNLIIMPASCPGAKTYLLGSNSSKVVRHADCAVLVVR